MSPIRRRGTSLVTVEAREITAGLARQFIDHAGLSDVITVVQGRLTDGKVLEEQSRRADVVEPFDFVFIDHDKSAYLEDLKYLMDMKLVVSGSVVVADNILFPGVPEYRKFVASALSSSSSTFSSPHEPGPSQQEKLTKGGEESGGGTGKFDDVALFETTEHFTHVEHLPWIKDCVTVSTML